ncbi:MAG: serine/threonine protein kinase [Chitinispirillaceae bacterium]|nr:serine/threonine protein kinase [Chitinispirillaceae bacterium]
MAFSLKDYKDIQEIARGGMGKVYLATQISLNRKVIIKEMATGLLTSANEIKRFENEARAAALLNHDNVIRIYDFGEDRGSFYISMEFIDGPDLETILRDPHCVPEIALMIVLHALKGLNYAHQHQIIHRDIKPGNILVSKTGAVKVLDFGLAHASSQQMHLTATDTIVGTPLYMSPEQASGEEKKSIQMDVWSVGVLLYRIITGDYPFKGDNVPAILFNIVQARQPPMEELAPTLPEDLAGSINLSLEKDRAARLTGLGAIIESLQNYFYEIGVKDTAETIRRYITDPAATVKWLSALLLEYHGRRGLEYQEAGDRERAAAHLRAVKQFDPTYKPVARPADTVKKHTSSALLRKTAAVPMTQRTGYHAAPPPKKSGPEKRIIAVAAVVALLIVVAGAAFFLVPNKKGPAAPPPAPADTVAIAREAVRRMDSSRFAESVRLADSIRRADSTAAAARAALPRLPQRKIRQAAAKPSPEKPVVKKAEPAPEPRAAAPTTGILKVSVFPSSAEVALDGVKLSAQESASGKKLPAGAHQIAARAAGYEPYAKTVTVEVGAVQIVSIDMVKQQQGMSSLHVHSYPWAQLYVDGQFKGNTPTAKPLALPEGTHSITLKRDGYKTHTESVSITKGEIKRVKVQLARE